MHWPAKLIARFYDPVAGTVRILRDGGVHQLHSRKLRSFDEPAFR